MLFKSRHPEILFRVTAFCFSVLVPTLLHAAPPKLVAVVVIDQFRPEYLDLKKYDYKYGFKTLLEQATVFPRVKINFIPTETAAGHATIVTGVPPSVHGIVSNDWFDKKSNKKVFSVIHPDKGTGPYFLEAPTVGDHLKENAPSSKVVSLSLKDRAAVLMGGHKADIAVWFDWKRQKYITSNFYKSPSHWLEEANIAIDDDIPSIFQIHSFLRSPVADQTLFSITKQAIDAYDLGQDDTPDLLFISFSGTDNIGHRFGPNSPEMREQLLSLDKILGDLLAKLDESSKSNFSLILTSDHGVLPLPEDEEGKKWNAVRIKKKDFLAKMENAFQKTFGTGPWIQHFSLPDIYLNLKTMQSLPGKPTQHKEMMAKSLMSLSEVAQVYTPFAFGENDPFTPIYKRSCYPYRSGDFMIRLKPGVLVMHESYGTGHGSPYEYDSEVPTLLLGLTGELQSLEEIAPLLKQHLLIR